MPRATPWAPAQPAYRTPAFNNRYITRLEDENDGLREELTEARDENKKLERKNKQFVILLNRVAQQLRRWARESVDGGWSTHQVRAQRDLASDIEESLL